MHPPGLVRVGKCESGEDLDDQDLSDRYGGTYQQDKYHWPERARSHEVAGHAVTDPWANIKVSVRQMSWGLWSNWPRCRRAYPA